MRCRFALAALSLLLATPAMAEGKPPAAAPAPVVQKDPLMQTTPGSGGKSKSYLVEDAPLGTDYVLGKPDAPVIILEYASLSCPHCAHFSNAVLPEIEEKYINTGKVRYILRQYPLNEPALKGAMLLDCVGEQSADRYYTFARVLFDAQSKWAFDGNFMEGLETIANVGGVSPQQFQGCLADTKREMKILEAKKVATEEINVPHTPYFFIDGEIYGDGPTFDAMSKFIDAKLAAKKSR